MEHYYCRRLFFLVLARNKSGYTHTFISVGIILSFTGHLCAHPLHPACVYYRKKNESAFIVGSWPNRQRLLWFLHKFKIAFKFRKNASRNSLRSESEFMFIVIIKHLSADPANYRIFVRNARRHNRHGTIRKTNSIFVNFVRGVQTFVADQPKL